MASADGCRHRYLLRKRSKVKIPNSKKEIKRYRLLELYCGIGGMRYALDAAGIPYEVVAAVDHNPEVGAIYKHNFGSQGHYQKDILSFTSSDIENMKIDIITMSPPSQPLKRYGKCSLGEDIEDERNKSFFHILTILKELQRRPFYILVENDNSFVTSKANRALIETMDILGYRYQEFGLSPRQFRIPNIRHRYTLIAKLREEAFSFMESETILCEMPSSSELHRPDWNDNNNISAYPIKHFLGKEDNLDIYFIPHDVVLKRWFKMYIQHENDDNSPRFTKEYQLDAPEAGPLLALVENLKVLDYIRCARDTSNEEERLHALNSIGLRFFTPKEVANLMLYPDHFSFPSEISVSQMYKSLVNSMNVYVVSCLMKLLFQTPD